MLFDYDMLFDLSNINTNDSNSLVDESTALERGNLFQNEYKPYKNYNPNKVKTNDLLKKLYETNFAIIDLNLYLDLHPDDTKMYEIYKSYISNYEKYKDLYEQEYGPLEITCVKSNNYSWINNPWPWDGGNNNV